MKNKTTIKCKECDGTGTVNVIEESIGLGSYPDVDKCKTCKGTGEETQFESPCVSCNGRGNIGGQLSTGEYEDEPCGFCKGTGIQDTCNCEEMTCKKDCNRYHTHKGFSCEVCKPKQEPTIEESSDKIDIRMDLAHELLLLIDFKQGQNDGERESGEDNITRVRIFLKNKISLALEQDRERSILGIMKTINPYSADRSNPMKHVWQNEGYNKAQQDSINLIRNNHDTR